MTIYFSVVDDWAAREASRRAHEYEAVLSGRLDVASAKKRQGLRRRDARLSRAQVRELLSPYGLEPMK